MEMILSNYVIMTVPNIKPLLIPYFLFEFKLRMCACVSHRYGSRSNFVHPYSGQNMVSNSVLDLLMSMYKKDLSFENINKTAEDDAQSSISTSHMTRIYARGTYLITSAILPNISLTKTEMTACLPP